MTNGINSINFNSNILANNNVAQAKAENFEDEQVFEFGAGNEVVDFGAEKDAPEEIAWVALVPAAKWLGGCIMAGVGGYLFNKAVGDC